MRSKLLVLLLGAGVTAAVALPALACSFNQASTADSTAPQQTAQADTSSSDSSGTSSTTTQQDQQ